MLGARCPNSFIILFTASTACVSAAIRVATERINPYKNAVGDGTESGNRPCLAQC